MQAPKTTAELRVLGSIESRTTVSDAAGGGTAVWSELATAWAKVIPLTLGQQLREGQEQEDMVYEIWIRYRSDVTTACRFRIGSEYYRMYAVVDADHLRQWLMMRAHRFQPEVDEV